ncbi:SRPBCC family protein [Nocardioides sp. MAH-18]|uniref:SRPBCC family protein n=2 Tax=Nocardioidaceae TaxID=85015 RepID=A0A6L6XTE0_9ACTN|nr:SRPBCC family protein [Nocardioides sp. CGMCC 1.13656]MVQ50449.1 SRPBCC family protein [Nocardioides sp. MAH-18]
MVDGPVLRMTRAVHVDAPPAHVWRWLCQMEVAPYSYDWIDNRGRRSPRELTPGVTDPLVGQRVQVFRVTDVQPGRQWSGFTIPPVFGRTAVTYAVEPDVRGSRLVCRILTSQRGPAAWVGSRLLAWGDLVMMRKQLLTLKRLAEAARVEP